ncbi:hypothetical protein BO86DRAFT_398242 [Aspergillus japonicus CBS 114.51]|uniref:Uncharacterized protein n=2 Tax=Aspergillus TaxID=5052 RepID=A0A2V5HBU1_ASPV1|nr:hypothetical protein BO86DRAFT_398242 [Aspergillus japonicus CBS 114.51]PYI21848.1 hypothetical protein BO99DRAFT_430349 [Aspergillus violaceofuscus CBS 115571]RAH83206.1 hypothetical protein BO86DRAFT_398242 [Aspergillus japonicus CBS 114.51]
MKFPTILILISSLAASVLAAPLHNHSAGSLKTTDRPVQKQPANHESTSNTPSEGGADAPITHVPVTVPDKGVVPSEHKDVATSQEKRQGENLGLRQDVCEDLGVCIPGVVVRR